MRTRSYELALVITPVLTDDDLQNLLEDYRKFFKKDLGMTIVHEDFWGLRQLAYPIKKKTTGVYLIVEFEASPDVIDRMELQFKRDENILRFMTTKLDKYALEYNEKKRKGLVGRKKKKDAAPAPDVTATPAPKKKVVKKVLKLKKHNQPKPKPEVPQTEPAQEVAPQVETPNEGAAETSAQES